MKKILKLIGKILLKILGLWNIYGSILASLLVAWLTGFSKGVMDNVTTFLIMNLAFMSTFTFLKWQIIEKKPNTIIEKVAMGEPSIRAMNTAIDPIHSGEEIGKAILETTNIIERVEKKMWNKIKKFFKWTKTYWQQIVGLLGVLAEATVIVYAYIHNKFGWLLQYFPEGKEWEIGVKIGVAVLAFLFVFFQIRNQVKWCGVGSIAKAQEYIEELSKSVETKLNPKTKANVKTALKALKKGLKEAEKKYNAFVDELNGVEEELASQKELLNLGLGNTQNVNDLSNKKVQIENELSKIDKEISNSQASIIKCTDILSVKML